MNYTNKEGNTALIIAAIKSEGNNTYCDTVKILLKSGTDVNIVNALGYTALTYANGNKLFGEDSQGIFHLLFAVGEIAAGEVEEVYECTDFEIGLKHMCREAIRKHLLGLDENINLFQRIPRLGLPTLLVKYLLYHVSLDLDLHEDLKKIDIFENRDQNSDQ